MTDPTDPPKPFQKVTEDSYAQAFADSSDLFPVGRFSRGVIITGGCPRCGHRMTFPVVNRIFLSVGTVAAHPDHDDKDKPVLCTCKETHPDRPDGEKGCGAYWTVIIANEAL